MWRTGPEVKVYFLLNSTDHEISTAHKLKRLNKGFACFQTLGCCIYILISVKMLTVVGIVTFRSMVKVMLI